MLIKSIPRVMETEVHFIIILLYVCTVEIVIKGFTAVVLSK